jgi:hypothetical protein
LVSFFHFFFLVFFSFPFLILFVCYQFFPKMQVLQAILDGDLPPDFEMPAAAVTPTAGELRVSGSVRGSPGAMAQVRRVFVSVCNFTNLPVRNFFSPQGSSVLGEPRRSSLARTQSRPGALPLV